MKILLIQDVVISASVKGLENPTMATFKIFKIVGAESESVFNDSEMDGAPTNVTLQPK